MKLYKYSCIMFLLATAVFPACRKERNLAYEGPSVLEFSNPLTGVNTKTTGQSIGGASGIGGDENIPIRGLQDSVIVQLIGAQVATPTTVTYTVTPGTAVEGVDFSIAGTKGTLVIPANSSSAAIKLNLLNNSTTTTAVNTVTFTITGSDNPAITPSANLKTFVVSIYPMKAWLSKTLPAGGFFSSRTGLTYTATEAAANPSVVDIAYVYDGTTPKLVPAASVLTGTVDSRYSAQVFAAAATVPANLLASYATLQLNAVTNSTVSAIPISGTTATAAVLTSVNIIANGIYGFVGASGKKGYIRIKSIASGASGNIGIDVMTQP